MHYHIDKTAAQSAYLQLYHQLRRDIVSGVYPLGTKMPSKRLIATETGVSVITVEHALAILCDEGYLESRERSGYFVIFRPADGFATKYLDDEDGEAGKPEKLSEKAAEIANETAADDAYRQALESFGKEKAEYGSEYDTSYSSVAADYSIYLEDGEGDESDEK